MPIPSHIFKELILKKLNELKEQPIAIEVLYEAAIQDFAFDAEDLKPPKLRGKETSEPSWKRNLRNNLQDFKSQGTIVNHKPGFWRLPTPNKEVHLDAAISWELIKQSAHKAQTATSTWHSPKDKKLYKIQSISDNEIVVLRHSKSTTDRLTQSDVERAIVSINAAGGVAGRRTLNYTVAIEAAMVYLHPDLEWDDNFEWIKVVKTSKEINIKVLKHIVEAENDDKDYQSYARKIRKGQVTLRRNLLTLYNQKCCITDTGPENVLQAAHIEPHSVKGDNHTTNALLLRSDIHDLFDDDLILIEPVSLMIYIHPSLNNTTYVKLNGITLSARTDGARPSQEKLQIKWDNTSWKPKL